MIEYNCPNKLSQSTDGAAGFDLISTTYDKILSPGRRYLISTELFLAMPQGVHAKICSRSGLALHHGVIVLNAPGIIDCDYRGEVCVLMYNSSQTDYTIRTGDKIAQLLFENHLQNRRLPTAGYPSDDFGDGGYYVNRVVGTSEDFLDKWPTIRGASGHGSTGR